MWLIDFFKNLMSKRKPGQANEWPGALPSPSDYRDILGSLIEQPVELPATYIIPYNLSISNQGVVPSCVGHAAAGMKEEKERRENNVVEFEGDWIYWQAKKIDNYPGRGTFLRTGMKILKDIGAKPKNGLEQDAEKYRIGGFIRVDDVSFEGLKRAVYQWGAIMVGLSYSSEG